ncbi:YjdF family protein [Bacillus sp. WMMC1349]|uniref:YjdF family protein n=1 Tax=Bacillus sp. WMMC1349 TaxID=2736254 RepID=UPI0015528887|nr:YjdF family protein [Bacillus sp. WMMC1349]NPC93435.1 YjdF family protein [Bacillus sp. WMMC1349]
MKLTIYYDGQFWIGIIEVVKNGKLKAYRHMFGHEPNDEQVIDFIHHQLLQIISQSEQEGMTIKPRSKKKINPKRLQRKISKEMKNIGVSTKAQIAIKQEFEAKKEQKKKHNKQMREKIKEQKYLLRKQKAKAKHRGK